MGGAPGKEADVQKVKYKESERFRIRECVTITLRPEFTVSNDPFKDL